MNNMVIIINYSPDMALVYNVDVNYATNKPTHLSHWLCLNSFCSFSSVSESECNDQC